MKFTTTGVYSLLVTAYTASASSGWYVGGFTGLNCNGDGPVGIGRDGTGCFNVNSKENIKSLSVEDLGDHKITLYDSDDCVGNKFDYEKIHNGCVKGHFTHPDSYANIKSWKIHY